MIFSSFKKIKSKLMKKIFTCLLLSIVWIGTAQRAGEDETGIWYMYFGTNKIAERFSIHTEAQFRYFETSANFNQMLLRTGVNYHINPSAIATLGYGFIETDGTFEDFANEENSKENRIFHYIFYVMVIQCEKIYHFVLIHNFSYHLCILNPYDSFKFFITDSSFIPTSSSLNS